MTVIYAAACEDCPFNFESSCDSTTHTVAERHAKVRGHEVICGSFHRIPDPDRSIASREAERLLFLPRLTAAGGSAAEGEGHD